MSELDDNTLYDITIDSHDPMMIYINIGKIIKLYADGVDNNQDLVERLLKKSEDIIYTFNELSMDREDHIVDKSIEYIEKEYQFINTIYDHMVENNTTGLQLMQKDDLMNHKRDHLSFIFYIIISNTFYGQANYLDNFNTNEININEIHIEAISNFIDLIITNFYKEREND